MLLGHCSKCGKTEGLMNCSRCHGATGAYCSKECQAAHWKIHKPVCKPLEAGEVWGIKILDNRYQPWSRQFQHVLLEPSHPVFTQGELCPVTAECGFPLLIWSEAIHGGLPAMENNQPAVYLRIELDDGFAPFHWQRTDPGTCIVVRQDRKLLTKEAIEIVYNFHSYLLDRADPENAESGHGAFGQPLNPEWLRSFADDYREDETSRGRKGFDFFP
ncbi:uncharacterized protein TRAVEDRAFT_53328 [Trametes versicolor FP-101664 SS1]|uniref:uncharacterized protein n=1 Tax=Trametes versicolor (strain FP-101664) TaxID=717944 RepID=UPI0004624252|nr:uncharacterized protein TRAVEDRAFT_53328 [Trametes versicolor FP-101664 SS1]EIW52895.1 hypothetical protein TRAVEDRAFT_53328 [Trametes versicolor FP-101664 SS1]